MEDKTTSQFWKDAKKELPPQTHGSYSDSDYLLARMYRYDLGRTYKGEWVNMKNEPLCDVILWAEIPKIDSEFEACFEFTI